ncbi:MAG: CocE/NonD family hydrolase [Ruminococcaceae bacterium]|nr:CocE/NonD family hydrolase [Oscillospiraceae bacterium]
MEFYLSGICYARFDPFRADTEVSLLDLASGSFLPPQPMDDETRQHLSTLSNIDLAGLPAKLGEAAGCLAARPASFEMSDGSFYERKDDHHYIQRRVKYPVDLIVEGDSIVGVQTPSRDTICIIVDPAYRHLTVLPEWDALYPQPVCGLQEVRTLQAPMHDGVRLATDVYLPAGVTEPVPCVLIRTPYGRQDEGLQWRLYAQRGFAVAVQDIRGRNDSGGDWFPLTCEVEDGSDTLDFLAAQPWCSGSIGMIGGSYLGYVQWAAAASKNPHLKAMVSEVAAGSAFVDMPLRGGTMSSGMLAWAFAVSQRKLDVSKMERDDWDEVLAYRPLEDVCSQALGYDVPFWRSWLAHPCDDEYWARGNWYRRAVEAGGIDVPALIQTGWFDDNGMGSTQALDLTANYPAGLRKVIMGPWIHQGNCAYDLHGVPMGRSAVRYDLDLWYFRWFEKHLKGRDCIPADTGAVEYFTVGQDRWKTSAKWPPEQTEPFTLYLASDGTLAQYPEQDAGQDTLHYDPAHPATHIIDMSENEIEVPEDYTLEEQRPDYLCFTTPVLEEDWTFTGDVAVQLYLSSNVPDTDLMVRITRVGEDGRSIKLADGILDVKYREGFDREVFMEPGQVCPVSIRTTKFSACFRKGQRLRFTVTSSAVNFSFPHSNTRAGFNSRETAVAANSIHFGGAYPSHITLRRETQA